MFGLLGAVVIGWFSVRLRSVYFAMLTLAFAQIVWAVFYQFEGMAGGENGITGVWPEGLFRSRDAFFYLTLGCMALSLLFLYRALFSPFGYALRAARDSAIRAESIGMQVMRLQWTGVHACVRRGWSCRRLFALRKGSISPETISSSRSIEGLVMVVMGGEYAIGGGALGAAVFVWLHDTIGYNAEYWRAVLGAITLLLLLVMPQGLARLRQLVLRFRGYRNEPAGGKDMSANPSVACAPTRMSRSALERGELLALIGPNGAGKSTMFNMINGQLRADTGSITLRGQGARRAAPTRDLAAGRGPHVPGRASLRLDDGH